MDPTLKLLRDRVQTDRKKVRIVGAVALALAFALWFVPMKAGDSPIGKYAFMGFLVVAALLFWRQGLQSPDTHPVLRALVDDGGRDVVWIYIQRVHRSRAHMSSWLVLGLATGKKAQIDVPKNQDNEIMRLVGAALPPQATCGYDPEHERRFKTDAPSLRRAA